MSELVEVVFENVQKAEVLSLLMQLVSSSGKIIDVHCSEDFNLMDANELDLNSLRSFLDFDGDACALIRLDIMGVGNIALPNILVRLNKYSDNYDIDFNFDLEGVENIEMPALLSELHNHASGIAEHHGLVDFFCGMEPASDEDTRYFTNEKMGPLTF